MLKSILFLLFISIIIGRVLRWLIFPIPHMICLPIYIKILVLIICIFGGLIGYLIAYVSLYYYNKSLNNIRLVYFCGSIWFMPIISTFGIIWYPLNIGKLVIKRIDQGWREYFGGQNIYFNLKNYSQFYQIFQNNNLKIYLLTFLLWIIIILLIIF